jgi:hypothetical protein
MSYVALVAGCSNLALLVYARVGFDTACALTGFVDASSSRCERLNGERRKNCRVPLKEIRDTRDVFHVR